MTRFGSRPINLPIAAGITCQGRFALLALPPPE